MGVNRNYRDLVYLIIVGTQLFGMLALDLVAFYPRALWQPPSSPLHFLVTLREMYVGMSGDPFFAHPQHEPWFQAMLYIEAAAQLPLAAFLVSRLWSARGASSSTRSSGALELAAVAFGSLTGMGSLTCAYHLQQLGPEVVSAQQKTSLLYGTYMPFAVIPIAMAIDMSLRVTSRISELESKQPKKQQ